MTDVQVTLGLPILQKGAQPVSGPTVVKKLQLMLNQRKSFPTLVVDGAFGPKTEASVKQFQQNEGLPANGIVDQQTWTTLLSRWLLFSEPG
jgi:peptidoglycan hydrolase-like protein with peptidoglycan-binding domain